MESISLMCLEDFVSIVSCPVSVMCVDAPQARGGSQFDHLLASWRRLSWRTITWWCAQHRQAACVLSSITVESCEVPKELQTKNCCKHSTVYFLLRIIQILSAAWYFSSCWLRHVLICLSRSGYSFLDLIFDNFLIAAGLDKMFSVVPCSMLH